MAAVIQNAIAAKLRTVRVMVPAEVVAYDAATCQISAQPWILEAYNDEEGDRVAERLPVIPHVPVVFPGSGGVRVRFPIGVGDTVMLVMSSQSLDLWLARGGEVDPEEDRRGALVDAVAIPGLLSFADAGDASPMIEFTTDGKINAGGSQALALKSDVDALRTAFNLHTHAYIPGPGSGTVPTLPPVAAAAATGTTILKGG